MQSRACPELNDYTFTIVIILYILVKRYRIIR
nr:MAG TPA: hypothetical protein [Caudoviricetes sp.]